MRTLPEINFYSLAAKGIMKVLLYSDVFQYPLTLEEIQQRHPLKNITADEIQAEIFRLVAQKVVFQIGEFYALEDKPEIVNKRLKANFLAKEYLEKSKRIVKILKYFPFVRAIFLSGSISKNYIDENSDIDYFIITKAGYLWIVRSLFVVFRRIALLGSRKLFCFNYMLDDQHLKTNHQSIYIATEIATLVPMYEDGIHQEFLNANAWVQDYYPNYPIQTIDKCSRSWFKFLGEFLLKFLGVKKMNRWLMEQTQKRKIRLFGEHIFSDPIKLSNFQPYIAKDNMKPHYQFITEKYKKNLKDFECKMHTSLV